MSSISARAPLALALAAALTPRLALAQAPTPGFPEAVVQWKVQKGETCTDVARSLYGSPKHVGLLSRYMPVPCAMGALPMGLVLVVPAKPTEQPPARLRTTSPQVQAKPPAGGWVPVGNGTPLETRSSVQTLETGRADVEFLDRTRVFLAANTLVVIYGTAAASQVAKVVPKIELDAGEVRAGLAALRGDLPTAPVDVTVKGGGSVEATSRDTVIDRKGDRTTVAVFDGKAKVSNAGRTVEVPEKYGSRFVGRAPPSPPRPLPPAPAWESAGSGPIVLAPAGKGAIDLAWTAVDKARAYRVELARDEELSDLAAREELGAELRSFRGDGLPAGRWHVSVRAIDTDDYLGLRAPARVVELVPVGLDGGLVRLTKDGLSASPYARLSLAGATDLEISLDDGPFEVAPALVDLAKASPSKLGLRVKGGSTLVVPITYDAVEASISFAGSEREPDVVVELPSAADPVVLDRMRPVLVPMASGGAREPIALTPAPGGKLTASISRATWASLDGVEVVDSRGVVLASRKKPAPASQPPKPPTEIPKRTVIGPHVPGFDLGKGGAPLWWSPTTPRVLVAGAAVGTRGEAPRGESSTLVAGQLYAGQAFFSGALGVEGAVRTNGGFDGEPEDTSAFAGLRVRLLQQGTPVKRGHYRPPSLEVGSALRVFIPVAVRSPALSLEPGLALGGGAGRTTWLGNVGVRIRLEDEPSRAVTPSVDLGGLLGLTIDLASSVRGLAAVDASVGYDDRAEVQNAFGRGGLRLGLELGGWLFGSLVGRVSPFFEHDTLLSGQLTVGVRQE